MAEKSQFHVYAGSKSFPLDWQPYDVMQSTETTFAVLELATQVWIKLDHGNVRGPVRRSERSEPKMKIQHWTNKRKLTESWSYGYLGSSLQKIESRVLIDKGALMIVHVLSSRLASSYPIRRAFLQHISWRVSVESVNKRKSSCHFAWRNGSIAVWMFVHPAEANTAVILDWKAFLSVKNYFYQHENISIIIKGESETCPNFWNRHIILSLKFIGSFEAAAFF